ncbi:hypothetical protein CA233_11305 [Sphingomonas sp. ABOLD]|uniref:Uncharacterized protein n=1 Tax=Sphingomonas trueperi TaxID=53317 RepID=A0A7X5Y0Y3_9SPHN|nr:MULTISPECIES: hypothetical protein [Sphingomonas]NJB98623.1 hypothetical protein [Sphingomonas trueperi]RSV47162.1 hypothetical protein CA233_11305 [Sphingomonas sp. ABOLD]
MLREDPICRYRLAGAPLYTLRSGSYAKLGPGDPVYPGMALAADQRGAIQYRSSFALGLVEF